MGTRSDRISDSEPIGRLGGGGKRDRTADLLHAMQALSQLSYTPTANMKLYGAGPCFCKPGAFRAAARDVALGYHPARDSSCRVSSSHAPSSMPLPSALDAVDVDLSGRVILVTGASGGLGKPLALACARPRRDGGPAWARRAQARGDLRRDRRRRPSAADDPAARFRHGVRRRFRSRRRARSARSSAGSTVSCTPPPCWVRWARSSTNRSMRGRRCSA